jgi:hypothetical protein
MSYEHPHILYIGNVTLGQALQATVESGGWHIDLPNDVDEGLALYIMNYPDVVILGGDMGEQVFTCLQPLLSTSPLGITALLMLGSAALLLPNNVALSLPADAKSDDLVIAVRSLLEAKQQAYQPAGTTHDRRINVFAETKNAI